MGADSAVGLNRGLLTGLEDVRARRYRAAQDALRQKEVDRQHERQDFDFARARVGAERQDAEYAHDTERRSTTEGRQDTEYAHDTARRSTVEGRQDTEFAHDTARRGTTEGREDTGYSQEQADRRYTLGRREVYDTRADKLYGQQQDDRSYSLGRRAVVDERQDTEFQQQQQDRTRMQQQLESEGLRDLVKTVMDGGDPDYALQRFNRRGNFRIDPSTFSYDAKTGSVKFTDSDGDKFDGTLEELGRTVGVVMNPKETVKLGKDERLLRPTREGGYADVTPARVPGTGSGEDGESPGGRKQSPYNAESSQKEINNLVAQNFEGNADLYGNWSVADAEDRRKVAYLQSLAGDMEGRLRASVMDGTVALGEISDAVLEAGKDVPTESELTKRANNQPAKVREQWMDTERTRIRAEVESRIATAEQRLLGKTAKRAAAAGKAKGAGSQADPYQPASKEEYDALPAGAFYLDEGKLYRKK